MLTMSYTDACAILDNLSATVTPSETMSKVSFVLYKAIAYQKMRNIYTFRISGMLSQEDNAVLLVYQIRPLITVLGIGLFLVVSLLSGIKKLLIDKGSGLFVAIGLLVNVLLGICFISQMRENMNQFECKFTTEDVA